MHARNKLFTLVVAALLLFNTCASIAPVGAAAQPEPAAVGYTAKGNNPESECDQDGCRGTAYYKIEKEDGQSLAGTYDGLGGGRQITIYDVKTNSDGEEIRFSWWSNFPVHCVVVKGAENEKTYKYVYPWWAGGIGLTAPKKDGKHPEISHITFCYTPFTHDLKLTHSLQTSLTRTYEWDIAKTANPTSLSLTEGETGEVEYTVSVTKSAPTDSGWMVSGEFCIKNPNWFFPVEITDVSVDLGEGVAVSLSGQSPPYTLWPGATESYTYSAAVPDASDRESKVTVTSGSPYADGATDSRSVSFAGATVNEVNAGINVDDSNGKSWQFGEGGQETYSETFDCEDLGTHTNMATIRETKDSAEATVTVSCQPGEEYQLEISKTVETSLTRTYEWEIEKTADPTSLQLTEGDSGEVEYTVAVNRTGYVDSHWAVQGTITIHNPADHTAIITSIEDMVSDDASGGLAADVVCPVSPPFELEAGETLQCTYTVDLPDASTRTNTVTVETSGHVNGGSATAEVSFAGATVNEVNASINVDDTNGKSWQFDESGQETYSETFDCEDLGTHTNTATIRETKDSAEATVTVSCQSGEGYRLGVSHSAQTSLTRTYNWGITKSVDKNRLRLTSGQKGTVRYAIAVTKSAPVDSRWAVSGVVTIHNPAPFAVVVTGVAIDLGAGVTVELSGPALPYTLAAGGDVEYTYTASLPNGSARTSTAAVTTNTANVSGSSAGASVNFSKAKVTKVRDTIHVDDTFGGSWAFDDSGNAGYSGTYDCGDKGTIHNTATIRETSQSATASVKVECDEPASPCVESNVTVIIHGGWAGIPVRAWVGGSEQPTLNTSLDSMGRAAATWTLYPPKSDSWHVRVEPQPLDGWEYRLLRIESPTSGQVNSPGSAEVSVYRCHRYIIHYELVQRTTAAAQEEPALLLPVTGAEPASGKSFQSLMVWLLTWGASLVYWWRSAPGR